MDELSRVQKVMLGALATTILIIELIGFKSSPLIGFSILFAVFIAAIFVVYRNRRSISGIVSFYSKRSSLPSTWWEKFYNEDKNPNEVIMMGQSIIKAFTNPKQVKAFIRWCNQGTKVKILFLSPSNTELDQLQIVGKGMIRTLDDDPNENLRKKIYESVNSLDEYVISKIPKIDNKPMVRFATIDLPFSLMAVDDDMVTTLYGSEAEGDEQPTFLVKGKDSEFL